MVKRHSPPETGESVCPACGAPIKSPPAARRRRVQCPKCREVVFLESPLRPETDVLPLPPPPPAPEVAGEKHSRIDQLEERVAALEATVRDLTAAARQPAPPTPPGPQQIVRFTPTMGRTPEYSIEQGDALFANLGGVLPQTITIRTPTGDTTTFAHAQWFKAIFERAGWIVRGPEEIALPASVTDLSLAVPELPVSKEAAATYLALKAAGFPTITVLDKPLRREAGSSPSAMALTVPGMRGT